MSGRPEWVYRDELALCHVQGRGLSSVNAICGRCKGLSHLSHPKLKKVTVRGDTYSTTKKQNRPKD